MSNWYHVWFPEGHTTSVSVPRESDNGVAADSANRRGSILQQYMREKAAKRKERLGKMASVHEIPHIFPNIGAVGRAIRVLHPQGPAESEIWTYILVDKDAPPEVKKAMVLGRQRISGPNGLQQKDDMENWFIQTRYSKGFSTRWRLRQNNQLGMSKPSIDGPSTFGMQGMFHPAPTDENYRRFFEHYALTMDAGSWDDILSGESAKLRAAV
jgi:hypothetical protein